MDIGHNSTARSLNLKTGSLDRVTILGNGNVGIGTSSPGNKLHVYNAGNAEVKIERASGAQILLQAQSSAGNK